MMHSNWGQLGSKTMVRWLFNIRLISILLLDSEHANVSTEHFCPTQQRASMCVVEAFEVVGRQAL